MSFVSLSRSFGRCIYELFDFMLHNNICITAELLKKKNITDSMITSRYVTVGD